MNKTYRDLSYIENIGFEMRRCLFIGTFLQVGTVANKNEKLTKKGYVKKNHAADILPVC
jgi:hypothetical protein